MPQRFVPHIINKSSKFLICSFMLIAYNCAQSIETGFSCAGKSPGFYADDSPLSGCSIYHRCNLRGQKTTFRCPEGTLFRQQFLVCAHAREVNCELSSKYYDVNSPEVKTPRELGIKLTTVPPQVITKKSSDNIVAQAEKIKVVKTQEPARVVRINRPKTEIPIASTQQNTLIKFPAKTIYLLSDVPVNPLCPLCEPFYLKNGSCSPCVIIR